MGKTYAKKIACQNMGVKVLIKGWVIIFKGRRGLVILDFGFAVLFGISSRGAFGIFFPGFGTCQLEAQASADNPLFTRFRE